LRRRFPRELEESNEKFSARAVEIAPSTGHLWAGKKESGLGDEYRRGEGRPADSGEAGADAELGAGADGMRAHAAAGFCVV